MTVSPAKSAGRRTATAAPKPKRTSCSPNATWRAHVDILVRHLAGCAKQADSAFWSDLARDLADPQFRTEYFSRAAQVVALNADTETLGG